MSKKSLSQEETAKLIAQEQGISIEKAKAIYRAVFGTLFKVLESREYNTIKTPIGSLIQSNIVRKNIILNGKVYDTNKKTYKFIPTPKIVKKETIKREELTNGQDKE